MRGKVALFSVASTWSALLALWPATINRLSLRPEISPRVGEGLYAAPLTEANVGLRGIEFFESREGKKQWNIRADFAELHRKENYAFLQDVDADFFADKTGNAINVKSAYGRSELEKHEVELEGNVVIVAANGYRFEMETLNYFSKTHTFLTGALVQMRGPDPERPQMILRGEGLLGNIDEEHFILKKNISAQKKLRSSQWLLIQSKSGEFFTSEQRAVFRGNVKAGLPQIEMQSESLAVEASKQNESLYAKGNVVLKNRNRVGKAKSATIEIGSNKIVLEGEAEIAAQSNLISGKRITLYTDDDRIEVEEAKGRMGP